jgi:hypothetical protein
MQNLKHLIDPSRISAKKTYLGLFVMLWAIGCGVTTGPGTTPATSAQQGPQNYFAPFVAGTTQLSDLGSGTTISPIPLNVPQTYSIDDKGATFSRTTYKLQPPAQIYSQVLSVGVLTTAKSGLRSLTIQADYILDNSTNLYEVQTYGQPKTGSFALELAGQTGGLVQLVGQPVAPLVAATQCPDQKAAQTYLFVTIPDGLSMTSPGQSPQPLTWDPAIDTAYGSVDISSTGSTVTLQNIRQFTLPSTNATGAPAQVPTSPQSGVCGPTSYGNITNVPGQLIVTNPGNGQTAPSQAKIGISTSGLLVEDNGAAGATGPFSGTSPPLFYNNVLGAGTGAIGLPKPSSAVDMAAIVGAQYIGFIYSSGIYTSADPSTGWSSHLASFGFSNVPSSCASVAPKTSTLIYGGDFTNEDPSACDFAIDLGTQDGLTNGLYPHATVWLGTKYAVNAAGPFPAVAIAGQLNGKYAIFVIGFDSTQPWGIYLLQSN